MNTYKRYNNIMIKRAAFSFFFFFMTTSVFSQSAYSGKEFVMAFGKNNTYLDLRYQNGSSGWDTIQLILRVTAIEQAQVTLTFNANPSLNDVISLYAGEIRDYKLSYAQSLAAYSGSAYIPWPGYENMKSIAISSTGKITLIAVNSATRSLDATLVMPVENLGTEYQHSGLPPVNSEHYDGAVMIATENNTEVVFSNNPAKTYILMKGEVYPEYSTSILRGRTVKTSKPVAYFLNATNVELKEAVGSINSRKNYNLEQIPPMSQWGTQFILPTLYLEDHGRKAIFARVQAKDRETSIRITYTNGTTETKKIDMGYYDLRIDKNNNRNESAAYIVADNQVSICVYHSPHDFDASTAVGDLSQPSVAWLPPVEQTIGSALISPLDIKSKHVYMEMYHDFIIITPTITKNNTMISIDGGERQSISSKGSFMWIADNIGGSGYSLGKYLLGYSNAVQNIYLNTTAFVENPAGMILMAYGQGSYTSYFYTAGAAARNLDLAFYGNNIHYQNLQDTIFNKHETDFRAEIYGVMSSGPGHLKWYIDGVEATVARDLITWNTTLPNGTYQIKMVVTFADGIVKTIEGILKIYVNNGVTVSGTVFPFVYYEEPELSGLFPITAKLYNATLIPQNPHAILAATPAHIDTATYYDGAVFILNTPKYPGYLGRLNNPGETISWEELGYLPREKNNASLLPDEKPQTDIGLFQFGSVKPGTYILTLERGGYMTRFAKITVQDVDLHLGHRELIPGNLNRDLTTMQNDIEILCSKISQFGDGKYDPFYDLNGDLKINGADLSLLNFYLHFFLELYMDTKACFENR